MNRPKNSTYIVQNYGAVQDPRNLLYAWIFSRKLPQKFQIPNATGPANSCAHTEALKDQLETIVADKSLALVDHYRIVRCGLYKGFTAVAELGDSNSLALLSGRLHENFRDCGRLTGELQRGPLLNIQNNVLVNPDYTRAIARIVSAVAPYPEAREAVIAALRDLDTESASEPALTERRDGGAENG